MRTGHHDTSTSQEGVPAGHECFTGCSILDPFVRRSSRICLHTENRALNAPMFLYNYVVKEEGTGHYDTIRARGPKPEPVPWPPRVSPMMATSHPHKNSTIERFLLRNRRGFGSYRIDRSATAAERYTISLKQVGRISGLWAERQRGEQ